MNHPRDPEVYPVEDRLRLRIGDLEADLVRARARAEAAEYGCIQRDGTIRALEEQVRVLTQWQKEMVSAMGRSRESEVPSVVVEVPEPRVDAEDTLRDRGKPTMTFGPWGEGETSRDGGVMG